MKGNSAYAEAGIALTAEFYKELLDHMSDGVYFVDRNRRILYLEPGRRRALPAIAPKKLLDDAAPTTRCVMWTLPEKNCAKTDAR